MTIDKQTLLAALKPVTREADIAGIGAVRLRQLTVTEVAGLREATKDRKEDFGLRLVADSVVGDDGSPLLGDDDLEALRAASHVGVDALVKEVLDINGFNAREAAVKN